MENIIAPFSISSNYSSFGNLIVYSYLQKYKYVIQILK